ncbi:MAG: class I SAM-dependent methyltransferase [Legionellaceae bacterium]|nr:class I SAM-dependent methyltransferase [Legionellaceae bacterium]
MHLMHRKTCRVCGSTSLTKVIDLGEQHLQGSFLKPGKQLPPMRKIPMTLLRCDPTKDEHACGLLQMEHSVPPRILYSAYWYRSGTNQTMRDHLKSIAEEACRIVDKLELCVLDIGCNDGTLLNFYPSHCEKFGVDPSDVAQDVSSDICVVQDLFPSEKLNHVLGQKKLDIITSVAMFYDLEDPVFFAKNIKQLLNHDGVWIFEMSYMPSMLEMNSYDTICHEHLEYYSLSVVEFILNKAGMKLVNATLNAINGGSICCLATHKDNFSFHNAVYQQNITDLRNKEFDLELDTDKPYRFFQEKIESHKRELSAFLRHLKNEGKKIHIYGASTKGNTILQWCDIDATIIDYAAERNSDKYGALTLGTEIPIISEAESRALNPDYYLVLPWHFKDEFVEREREMLQRGVGLIFPLPKLDVVKYELVLEQEDMKRASCLPVQ